MDSGSFFPEVEVSALATSSFSFDSTLVSGLSLFSDCDAFLLEGLGVGKGLYQHQDLLIKMHHNQKIMIIQKLKLNQKKKN